MLVFSLSTVCSSWEISVCSIQAYSRTFRKFTDIYCKTIKEKKYIEIWLLGAIELFYSWFPYVHKATHNFVFLWVKP